MSSQFNDNSMLELFRLETDTHASALSEGLLTLESRPNDASLLESLMRAAHSIKGAARLVDVPSAVEVAHVMEDCFVAAQAGRLILRAEHVDILLTGVDMLSRIAKQSADQLEQQSTDEQHELQQLVAKLGSVRDDSSKPVVSNAAHNTQHADNVPRPATQVDHDVDMLDLFRIEVETNTDALTQGLLELETSADQAKLLEALMRAAHSIKGAARLVDVASAVDVAHSMEDCFVAAQEARIQLLGDDIDVLLRSVDLLASIAQLPNDQHDQWREQNQPTIAAVTAELGAILRGEKSPQQPKPNIPQRETNPTAAQAPAAKGGERVLRISTERVNRLVGYAGEFRVSAGWLRSYADSLLILKRRHTELLTHLDRLHNALDENTLNDLAKNMLQTTQSKADECRQSLAARISELEDFDRRISSLTSRLNHEVITSRMRPFGDAVQGFKRMVRDIARSLGKQVELHIAGLDTQVDRDILEKIEAPLNHLLRNAVDHGIESPEQRAQAGKPEIGSIRLEALHSAGLLSIVISDDGRGVDLDGLRKRIVEREMVSAAMAADLSESELLDFLFLPAFSTRDQVTEVSGRGVGLDVVHSTVQEMRGQIRSTTNPGQGMCVNLQLPLTLSVIRSLIVRIAGELYAFPLARIEHILKIERSQIETLEDRQYITYGDQHIGLVDAAQVLGRKDGENSDMSLPVVVIGDRNASYGLVVEQFIGRRDLAVHTIDPRLGKIQDISAAAITEEGEPVLIFDVDDLARSIDVLVSGKRLHKVKRSSNTDKRTTKRILVVDDSLTVREVERKLLQSKGYEVDVAVDGMDGWNTVRTGDYDLIISDIDMPRLNGIELVTMIKRDPVLRALPVMIVSYKDRPEDRDRGLDAGADYYLAKGSFHDETLINSVNDLIGAATA